MSKQHDLATALDRFLKAAGNAKRLRAKAALEAKLEKAMTAAFRKQGKWFVKAFSRFKGQFQEAVRKEDLDALWDEEPDGIQQAFATAIDKATREALLLGGQGLIDDLAKDMTAEETISFDLENPRAVDWLKDRAAARVTMIDETTRDTIGGIVNQGIASGASYTEIAKQLVERFEEFAIGKPQAHIDSRAHLIAITEAGEAYCEGNLQAGKELQEAGIEMEKSWLDVGDNRVSNGCRDNAAAGWIPLDDTFPSGHLRPLRFPGCRCDILLRRKKEKPDGETTH